MSSSAERDAWAWYLPLSAKRRNCDFRGKLNHNMVSEASHKVIIHAVHMLSSLSQLVGVVMAPRRTSVFRHIEFLRLSEKRFLVIIVSPDGDVQNRVIFTEADYTQSQLIEAANFLNSHYAG